MKHARIILENKTTDKGLLMALDEANKLLVKRIAKLKRENRLTLTSMQVAIKLAFVSAGFSDDTTNINISICGLCADIATYDVCIEHADKQFQVAIDTL